MSEQFGTMEPFATVKLTPGDNVRMGIVGAGAMGQGIAQIASMAGIQVLLVDIDPGAAVRAVEAINDVFAMLCAKGRMTDTQRAMALENITTADLEAVSACDLVIEAVVEKLDVKRALFERLEHIVSEKSILASNTSSLSITAIAAGCKHPGRVAGFHFFNPVPLMKVVEVVSGLRTHDQTVAWLSAVAHRMGHTAVRCIDMPGFIVNHAGRALNTEGLRIVQEGVTDPHTVDAIVTEQMGFRMGPFALLDLTGLDVSHPVMESIYQQFYQEPRFRPSPITAVRYEGGIFGRKTGAGFYDYPARGLEKRNADTRDADATLADAQSARDDTIRNADDTVPIWISRRHPHEAQRVASLLKKWRVPIENGSRPSDSAIIIVTPLGYDATHASVEEGLDPARVIGIDALLDFDTHSRRVLMPTPATRLDIVRHAATFFSIGGDSVSVIRDSGGFVAQRMLAMIINTACEIAQQRIASPQDIDTAVRLGLGYPEGPLSMGDAIGTKRLVSVLRGLMSVYADPRYRPSVWLTRRAALGLSLTHSD